MKKNRWTKSTSLAVVAAAVGALFLPAAGGAVVASGEWACDFPHVVCHTPK